MEQDPAPERAPKLPLPVVTIVLAVLNIGAWLLSVSLGADPLAPSADKMFELGGNFGPATLDGESWRLVSSMFLHYGLLHIAMNMLGLIDGGRHVERMYGRAGFAALYLFSGLVGGLFSALPGKAVSAGASGAVFGVFGAFAAYLLLHRDRIDKESLSKQAVGLLVFLGYNVWFGLTAEGIDMRAHLGGLGAGFVSGLILATPKQQRARVIGVFVASALTIGAAHVIPKPQHRVLLASAQAKFEQFAKIEQKALDRYNELVKDQTLDEAAVAKVIEEEVLPTWREGKALVASISHLPDELGSNLRGYIDAREAAWVAIAAALRKNDEAALAAAMNQMSDAEKYIEKLKP
jgi:rhomboid protease GluP